MSYSDNEPERPNCPSCGGKLFCHNTARCDWGERSDPRYDVKELGVGWQFMSPIGRMEAIVRVEDQIDARTGYDLIVWTEQTGPDYGWNLSRIDKVEAIPPRLETRREPAAIYVIDLGRDMPIRAVIAFGRPDRYQYRGIVAEAGHKRGEGWTIASKLNGRDATVEQRESKSKARTVLRQFARTHAKALGLQVVDWDAR